MVMAYRMSCVRPSSVSYTATGRTEMMASASRGGGRDVFRWAGRGRDAVRGEVVQAGVVGGKGGVSGEVVVLLAGLVGDESADPGELCGGESGLDGESALAQVEACAVGGDGHGQPVGHSLAGVRETGVLVDVRRHVRNADGHVLRVG